MSSGNGKSYSGTVKWFNEGKGYGFIAREGLPDVFVHVTDLRSSIPPLSELTDGDSVSFDVIAGKNGKDKAVNVKLV